MNFLITGIAGLIGSNFAEYIIKNNLGHVIGIDNFSGGFQENLDFDEDLIVYNRDLSEDSLDDIFKSYNIDYIYHFAAYAAEGLSPFIREFNYKNNVISSAKLINYAINFNIKRFIFTSSMAVYGHGEMKPPFHENFIPHPIDPYGIAKYTIELDLEIANKIHDLNYCIIRPHNVYGKRQNIWDKYRNVLGIWMNRIINNEQPIIYGDGSQTRAFTYINDILPCLYKAGISDSAVNQIINLGGIYKTSIQEACDVLLQVCETNLKPIYLEARHEAKDAHCTFQKSIDLLDFKHETLLYNGLSQMWNWAVKQNKRPSLSGWNNIEISKKLYSYWS